MTSKLIAINKRGAEAKNNNITVLTKHFIKTDVFSYSVALFEHRESICITEISHNKDEL